MPAPIVVHLQSGGQQSWSEYNAWQMLTSLAELHIGSTASPNTAGHAEHSLTSTHPASSTTFQRVVCLDLIENTIQLGDMCCGERARDSKHAACDAHMDSRPG